MMGERIGSSWWAIVATACTFLVACGTPSANGSPTENGPSNPEAVTSTIICCDFGPAYPAFVRLQAPDGSYSDAGSPGGDRKPDITATCLVTLALLGDGSTMRSGRQKAQIKNATRWLRDAQRPDGTLGAPGNMLEHGIATYTLVEAAGLSKYRLLWNSANPAVKTLLANRNDDGGWSSGANQDHSDAQATAWCVMACMSTRHFDRTAPAQPSNENLLTWFDHHPATTAEHAASELLCRAIAGQTPATLATRVLAEASPEDPDECFWASSALYLLGGTNWKKWQVEMEGLEAKQNTDIESALFGCYPPAGRRGPIGTTALVGLALEAYYGYSHLLRTDR